MNNKEYKVSCHLFSEKLDIVSALTSVAGQENCDDEEYDLMVEAAEYIKFMREENKKLKELLPDVLNTLETLEPYNDKEEIQARVEEALSDYEPEPEPKPPIVVNEALPAAARPSIALERQVYFSNRCPKNAVIEGYRMMRKIND